MDRTARRLRTLGVEAGERVAITAEIRTQVIIGILGLLHRPATAVLLPPNGPEREYRRRLKTADVDRILSTGPLLQDMLSVAGDRPVLCLDETDRRDVPFVDRARTGPTLEQRPTPSDDAIVAFTSGTTGPPKGVRLTHENLRSHANMSTSHFSLGQRDLWYAPLPIHHMGGFGPIVRAIVSGAGLLVQPYEFPDLIDGLRGFDVTMMSLVPTQVRKLLKHPSAFPPPSLRCLLVGGSNVPRDLKESCLKRDIPIHASYGMTETTSHVAVAGPENIRQSPDNTGAVILPAVDISIDTDTNDERGEILVDGPMVSPGYTGDRTRGRQGPLKTGDIGKIDENGHLHVHGRLDETINSGGELISPAQIERTLREHESVNEAVVVGTDDPKWGEAVSAVIQSETELSEGDIRSWCRDHLVDFKIPKRVVIRPELPRTAEGNIDRNQVRNLLQSLIREE